MATKTFSSRADVEKLAYADMIARREQGISFGQFCGTAVLDYVVAHGKLPQVAIPSGKKKHGISKMLELSNKYAGSKYSTMSDSEIKEVLASRYE